MKVEIKEYCVRCGICVGLYPELFAHNFDKDCIDVKYDELPAELEETAKNAARDCAVIFDIARKYKGCSRKMGFMQFVQKKFCDKNGH